MKAVKVLHKSVILAGIILAVMGAIVATVLDAPVVLISSALAVASAGYGYIKLKPQAELATVERASRHSLVGSASH
jgi:hypothetical protein